MKRFKFGVFLILFFLLAVSFYTFTPNIKAAFLEKFTNTTFDSDLSGWTGAQNYTLNDEFSDTRAAGSVNGTSATPTGGTRTVTDTNNKISVGSGVLNFATGETSNDSLWYPSETRVSGKIFYGRVVIANTNGTPTIGWDSNTSGTIYNGYQFTSVSGELGLLENGVNVGAVGTYTATTYDVAVVMRGAGMLWFIKGGTFTNWTLIWTSLSSPAVSFPAIGSRITTSVFTADNIRIPTTLWLPTPLAYSTFTSNGATATETTGPDSQTTPSLNLTGGTVAGGALTITPTLGSEIITNNGFDTDTIWSKGTGWTIAGGLGSHASGAASGISQNATIDQWYQVVWDIVNVSGGYFATQFGGAAFTGNQYTTPATSILSTGRVQSFAGIGIRGNTNTVGDVDNVSAKPLTLSSLFSTVPTTKSDVIVDANVTLTSGTQAGLVLNLDSASNPQNFILVYHNGTTVKVDEAVAGVYTNIQSTTVTYSAGATLRAIRDGTKLRVYYNNALVGSELTMTANTNTIHGMFSTYASNSFDNFTVFPRGTGGEFVSAPFEELTATYDTSIKYSGGGSAKLVAGGTNANFSQSLNVGGDSLYNLSAYAYTTGSPVTSSDIQLEVNGSPISTTYTSVGSGWYKLTGSAHGVNSSIQYGVTVMAGKTVYLDDVSLNQEPFSEPSAPTCSDRTPTGVPLIYGISSLENSIQFNFTVSSGNVSYYALEFGTKPGVYNYSSTNIGGSGAASYTLKGLTPGTLYYFRIRSGNGCSVGFWSSEVVRRTLGAGTISSIPEPIMSKLPTPVPAPTIKPTTEPARSLIIPGFVDELTSKGAKSIDGAIDAGKELASLVGDYGGRIFTYLKETSALGLKTFVALAHQPGEFSDKVGNWITYSKISFKEMVLDDQHLTIANVGIVKTSSTSATISWETNHLSNSKVNFGTTRDYGDSKEIGEMVHNHSVEIKNLKPDTSYFYEVMSQNNEYVYDAWHEFKTEK